MIKRILVFNRSLGYTHILITDLNPIFKRNKFNAHRKSRSWVTTYHNKTLCNNRIKSKALHIYEKKKLIVINV